MQAVTCTAIGDVEKSPSTREKNVTHKHVGKTYTNVVRFSSQLNQYEKCGVIEVVTFSSGLMIPRRPSQGPLAESVHRVSHILCNPEIKLQASCHSRRTGIACVEGNFAA